MSVIPKWKRLKNGSVVSIYSAFTTRNFGDHSLIVVTDYHPESSTIDQRYPTVSFPRSNRNSHNRVEEKVLWSFVVQLANALRAIHSANLAARLISSNKILVTDEGRIRLNGCFISDVLDDESHTLGDLQRMDLRQLGQLILKLGSSNTFGSGPRGRAPDPFAVFAGTYSSRLSSVIKWLLDHSEPENSETIEHLLKIIAPDTMLIFDSSLHLDDQLQFSLNQELENSRLVRLLTKLNCLNGRHEYERDRSWSDQGPRIVFGLFRDYVFHQVDAQGRPVVDMGHMVACLNKLDVGVEERIMLTTRDRESVIVVSYKELKTHVESAWQELMRRSSAG